MFAWIGFIRYLNWDLVQKTSVCAFRKRLTGLAAEMSFHAMLGLFPVIIAMLTAISLFENSVELRLSNLAVHFADLVPIEVWTLLQEFVADSRAIESKSWFSLSSIAAVWLISGVLCAAINALDQIHQVAFQNRRSYLQTKVVAISLTILSTIFFLVACFLIWIGDFLLEIALYKGWDSLLLNTWKIFSLIIIIAIATTTWGIIYQFKTKFRRSSEQKLKLKLSIILIVLAILLSTLVYICYLIVQNMLLNSTMEIALGNLLIKIWRSLGFPIALGIVATTFALIYRYGASKRIKNTPIFPGAILAAISWAIASLIFRFYVSHIGIYSKIYGAVGTVIILMLWLYLSSLVMLIGEQVNVLLGKAIVKNNPEIRRGDQKPT